MSDENPSLGKSAQSVQDVLSARGLDLKVIQLSKSTRTAHEAALSIKRKP